jgi:hypothetical protein
MVPMLGLQQGPLQAEVEVHEVSNIRRNAIFGFRLV